MPVPGDGGNRRNSMRVYELIAFLQAGIRERRLDARDKVCIWSGDDGSVEPLMVDGIRKADVGRASTVVFYPSGA